MSETREITRREFLEVSALAGGGLVVAVALPARPRSEPGAGAAEPFAPNAFLRVLPDDTVVVTVPKSEMGQGIRTTLALLVAEELDADWGRVRVETAPFGQAYAPQGTFGSTGVLHNWIRLRVAGATARAMLVSAAAARWGVPFPECATEPSAVVHRASGRRASYGSLGDDAARQPVPTVAPTKKKSEWRLLGKEHVGKDVADITHGRARYGIDTRLPGMLFASIERTPVFGGRVRSFDAAAALRVPGVKQVVEIAELRSPATIHAGVAVVATSTWAAMQGRKALRVEWEPGQYAAETTALHRAEMQAALRATGAELVNRLGDPDAVIAAAGERVISAEYELPFLSHATMEPMNCTAWARDGGVELWAPTQAPDGAAGAVAGALGVAPDKVKVNVTLMGGGFGRRANPDFAVEAALVARQVAAPVQVLWTREDDLRHDFYRPCAMHRIDAVLGDDGYPVAWRQRLTTAAIAASGGGPARTGIGVGESDGASNMLYRVPNRSCEYTLLRSGVTRGYWRGVHTTHSTFAVESFIDELAERAGKDPVEYRLHLIDRLAVDRPQSNPSFPWNPERLKGVLRLAAEAAAWGKPLPRGHFVGVACGIDHLSYGAEVVELSVADGRLVVHRVVCAADAGPVLNPNAGRAQLEGGITQALSAATRERITIAGGRVEQGNYDRYQLLRMPDAPLEIVVRFVEHDATVHPTGLGEPSVPPLAPALANAIYRATGKRVRALPIQLDGARA